MTSVRRLPEDPTRTKIFSRLTPSYGTISARSSEDDASFLIDPDTYCGRPKAKRRVELLDVLTLSISFLCLAVSAVVVKRNQLFRWYLTYADEVIAIVTLLGIENLCMMRLVQSFFLLCECRYGQSTLHNYEGILQWSAFVPRLDWIWKTSISILCALPLVLNVVYNYFTGGSSTVPLAGEHMICGPTTSTESGPISPKWSIPTGISILATQAAPFLSRVVIDEVLNSSSYPQPYGFNVLLLSNVSAAGLDAPLPEYIAPIQKSLSSSETVILSATVRATVVTHSLIDQEIRADKSYWQQFYHVQSLERRTTDVWRNNEHQEFWVGMLNCGIAGSNEPAFWNASWLFTGGYSVYGNITRDPPLTEQQHQQAFNQVALRFDAKRHLCNATWTITDTSVQLSQGACEDEPLPDKYQWMQNAQTFMVSDYWSLLFSYFRCLDLPDVQNCNNPWRISMQTVTIALAYQATIAASQGWAKIQLDGPLWKAWENDPSVWQRVFWDDELKYFERYPVETSQQKTLPTLRRSWALVWTVAIMPGLTLFAFIGKLHFHALPIGPDFGILSLLAGTDRLSLDMLNGAAFSGQTSRKIFLQVKTVSRRQQDDETPKDAISAIEYRLGARGSNDQLRRGVVYG